MNPFAAAVGGGQSVESDRAATAVTDRRAGKVQRRAAGRADRVPRPADVDRAAAVGPQAGAAVVGDVEGVEGEGGASAALDVDALILAAADRCRAEIEVGTGGGAVDVDAEVAVALDRGVSADGKIATDIVQENAGPEAAGRDQVGEGGIASGRIRDRAVGQVENPAGSRDGDIIDRERAEIVALNTRAGCSRDAHTADGVSRSEIDAVIGRGDHRIGAGHGGQCDQRRCRRVHCDPEDPVERAGREALADQRLVVQQVDPGVIGALEQENVVAGFRVVADAVVDRREGRDRVEGIRQAAVSAAGCVVVDEPDHICHGQHDFGRVDAAQVRTGVEERIRTLESGRRVVGESAIGGQDDRPTATRRHWIAGSNCIRIAQAIAKASDRRSARIVIQDAIADGHVDTNIADRVICIIHCHGRRHVDDCECHDARLDTRQSVGIGECVFEDVRLADRAVGHVSKCAVNCVERQRARRPRRPADSRHGPRGDG